MLKKIIRKFCLYTWRFWEKLGVHVVPNHFYWPIQDSRKLEAYDFDSVFPLNGISMHMETMKKRLAAFGKYRSEYKNIHFECGYSSNGDGAILYSMLRELKPNIIIEVGSGYSTVVMHSAQQMNQKDDGVEKRIISIEPYPKPVLRDLVSNSNVTLIERRVEQVEESFFQQLSSGDVLFIDTSHVVDIANDVHFLYLRILPQVPVGVFVHIHDIRFPYEYPKEWVLKARKHWAEQYLLHMFLAFNDSFEIIFASNYLCQAERKLMATNLYGLSETGDGWPGSFWIRRVK
jgi:predicted O-methyltransferase YrrM